MQKKVIIGAGLVAAAAIAAVAFGLGSAKAADLGGNCCADLEERVAELEATVAKKGNRKVTLSISGHVGHQVMWWDDGGASDMYIGDGGNIFSRFRIKGEAKINPELTAGFLYEFGINNNAIGSMNQINGGDDLGGGVTLRDSTVWLRHKNLGMLKIGHGSTATDNLILIDLGGLGAAATPDTGLYNGGFLLRGPAGLGTTTWGHMINGGTTFDTTRRNHVLYETPALAGFTVQAAVAEDDFFDVALRYAGEFGGFRLAFGIGHSVDKEAPTFGVMGQPATEIKTTMGSASILHMQSGLFLNAAGGQREFGGAQNAISAGGCIFFFCLPGTGTGTSTPSDATFWHVAGGWSKNAFGIGNTVLFAEYQKASDMIGYSGTWNPVGPPPAAPYAISSDMTMWGVGVVQHIDAAAMEVFITYKRFSGEINAVGANGPMPDALSPADFSMVLVGTKINF